MNLQEALGALEEAGTAQNRKVYARHGVGEAMYGVSVANLKKLVKQIKKDHDLAQALWDTGNHDARYLATLVADPVQAGEDLLDGWVGDLDNYVITDAFTGFASRTADVHQKMEAWTASEEEWVGRAGWGLLAHLAMKDKSLTDDYLIERVEEIKRRIHGSQNRVRDAMNNALIAIGIRNPELQEIALEAAAAIGKIDVDHGETSCKTPDAADYIHKTLAYREKKKAKK